MTRSSHRSAWRLSVGEVSSFTRLPGVNTTAVLQRGKNPCGRNGAEEGKTRLSNLGERICWVTEIGGEVKATRT